MLKVLRNAGHIRLNCRHLNPEILVLCNTIYARTADTRGNTCTSKRHGHQTVHVHDQDRFTNDIKVNDQLFFVKTLDSILR